MASTLCRVWRRPSFASLAMNCQIGYYSLAMSAIRKESLSIKYAGCFPNFPLLVARLARLAVAIRHQRKGLGELLVADALQRCLRLSIEIGMIGVIVDAKDERAREWYERHEFERLPDSPPTLWLPIVVIEKLLISDSVMS